MRGVRVEPDVRVFGQDDKGKTTIPAVGPLVFGKLGPRVRLPEFAEDDHAVVSRDFLGAADDITEFRGEPLNVASRVRPAFFKQLVVAGMGEEFAFGVFLLLEHESIAHGVDVEAVLLDQRHFRGKRVVIHRHPPRDVALDLDRLGTVDLFHAQRAQPERADDVGGVRDVVVGVFDGGADGFEVSAGLLQQQPVNLVGDGTEQRRDAAVRAGLKMG